jgi:hypothetical protein
MPRIRHTEPKIWEQEMEGKKARLLLAKDLDTFLNRFLRLLAGSSLGATEDELGNQMPFGGDVPVLGDGGVDEGVVVLEVCAEAEGFEAGPDWLEGGLLAWFCGCGCCGCWRRRVLRKYWCMALECSAQGSK